MNTGGPAAAPAVRPERGAQPAPVALHVALATVGLMAGLFFAWDVSVMPGLAMLDDRAFVTAMQAFVVAIENPAFYLVSFGALASTAVAAIAAHRRGGRAAARWVAAAFGCYAVALLVTMVIHMPINDALLVAGDPTAARDASEVPWRVANLARTVTCVVALVCIGKALSRAPRT